MQTYQEFLQAKEISEDAVKDFIIGAISKHKASDEYKTAIDADAYDKQQNTTILNYIKYMYNSMGVKVEDFTASNNKICSNFFHRLNTQRNTYLLGNGVSFTDHKRKITDENGKETTIDETKQKLGKNFDKVLKKGAYKALIHEVNFGFWNLDHLVFFPVTEFVPMWDEDTSDLRGGIRFWQIKADKPLMVVLYEEDGYTKYRKTKEMSTLQEVEAKRGYIKTVTRTREGGVESTNYSNYVSSDGRTVFPIVPLWGSEMHQSTLVGMKGQIDIYDLVKSGFANDLDDVAEIYWILNGADGMSDKDISEFRRKLKLDHIANVDAENSSATPHTQEIPYNARETFLTDIRSQIYEDFGGLDVHTISAGATNDHIDAAYQPMDEEADDYEFQVTDFIQSILDIMGIEDNPIFKRNRISNQKEQTDMVLSAAEYLDTETILNKLPFITVDEVSEIMARKDAEMEQQAEMMEGAEDEDLDLDDEEEDDSDIDGQLDALLKSLEE